MKQEEKKRHAMKNHKTPHIFFPFWIQLSQQGELGTNRRNPTNSLYSMTTINRKNPPQSTTFPELLKTNKTILKTMILNDLPSSLLTIVYDFLTPNDLIRLVLVSKNTLPFLNESETQRKFFEHLVNKWGLTATKIEKSKVEEVLRTMGGVQDLARLLVVAQPLPQGLFTNEGEMDLMINHDTAWFRGSVGLGNRSVQSFVPFPPIHPKMAVTLLSAVKELSAWSMLMIDRFVNTVRASVPRTVTSVGLPMDVSIYTRFSSSQLLIPNALINFAMMKRSSNIEGFSLPTSLSSSPLIQRKRSVSLPTIGSSR